MRSLQVMGLVAAATSVARAGNPLDKPAFTTTPQELLAAAKGLSPDDGAWLLRDDEDTSYDDQGRASRQLHVIVAVTSEEGVDTWGSLSRGWSPWFQDRPTVRARVITAAGEVHELDPAKVDERTVKIGSAKFISAPLTGVAPGSVIEYAMEAHDREPAPGGHSMTFDVAGGWPLLAMHLTVSAPPALHLHVVERAFPAGIKGQHAVTKGRETWSYAFGKMMPTTNEEQLPPDVLLTPRLAMSPAPSWSAVAKTYAAAVDSHLALAYPPELPRGDSLETARAITSWIHHHVTYTGAEIDDEPVAPIDLAAVLKRGSGNASEMAALLVALLRGAGMRADLALLDRNTELPLDRDVPALSIFNVALVRATTGGTVLWIDPTDRDEPIGQLPGYMHDQPVLSIADGALVTTPVASAAANPIRETRTLEPVPLGFGHVHEQSTELGMFEADQRQWVRERGPELRKDLTTYVKDMYRGELAAFTPSDPQDFSKPQDLGIDVTHSERIQTVWRQIEVHLRASDTTARLPPALKGKHDAARIHDLETLVPQVYEIENRIVVPEGFTIPAAPPDRTREVGVIHVSERHRVDGRTYIVTFRLELAKPRLTAAEVNTTRQALTDLASDKTDLVFANTAWALADKGKFRESLAELDRLTAADPKNAYHRARRAQVLLLMGDGEGARRDAKQAVDLAPKDPTMYSVLGFVLSHDLIGREWAAGHDHAGARAALEKALSIDPKHYGAVVELANLLERDERGRKYEPGADPRAAAEAWRKVQELEPSDDHAQAVIRNLLWAGDGAAAEKLARARPASTARDMMLVAAVAMSSGTDAAIRAAPASGRDSALDGAAGLLMMMRRYDLMNKLFDETGSMRKSPKGAALAKLKRFDAFRPKVDPKDVVMELSLEELDAARPHVAFWDAGTATEVLTEAAKLPMPRVDGMTNPMIGDMLQSLMTEKVDGDANAWRVEVDVLGTKDVVYLAADHGTPKVIGTASSLEGVGRHVLRLAGKHDDAAMRLLDWMTVDAPSNRRLDKMWGTAVPRDAKLIVLAGALLADDAEHNIAAGKQCGLTTTDGQLMCDNLVADGYTRQHKPDELLEHATSWAARVPSYAAIEPTYARIDALLRLGRLEDAESSIDEALAKHPNDKRLLYQRIQAAYVAHHPDEVATRADALVQASPHDAVALNNVAWTKIATGVALDSALVQAREAADLDKNARFIAHTLAGALAEADDLRAAVVQLQHAIGLAHGDPESSDWYVVGRIREKAGLRDDAITAYRRVTKSTGGDMLPTIYDLAAARLKALGVANK